MRLWIKMHISLSQIINKKKSDWLISLFINHPGWRQWSWEDLVTSTFWPGQIHPWFLLCYRHHWLHSEYASWQDRTVWAATGCQNQTPLDVITSHLGENSITGSIPVQLLGFSIMSEMDKEYQKICHLIWQLYVITAYKVMPMNITNNHA